MNHIELFENYFNRKQETPIEYLWPEARFWLSRLEPEEISYLAIYSFICQKERGNNKPLFEVEYQGSSENSPEEGDDGSFEFYLGIPINDNENKETLEATLSSEIYYSGGYTKYYAATHYDPEEGGEFILNNISVGTTIYIDENGDKEYNLESMQYNSTFVNPQIIDSTLIEACEYLINSSDSQVDYKPYGLPQGLIDKCESIRKEYPDLVKGVSMLNRFKRGN